MNKVLVVGGTGMLGKPVALQLKKDGCDVTVFTRNASDARIKMPSNFQFTEGNVSDIESLRKAMSDIDAVHINLAGGPSLKSLKQTEWRGTENIVSVAIKAGIKKITLITGSSIREENTWFKPTLYKFMAEKAVIESGIPYVIFRPSWFMETLPLMIRNGNALLPGNNNKAYSWIAAADYAQLVSKAIMTSNADYNILPVAGIQKITMEEALKKYCAVKCADTKIIKIPINILKLTGLVSFNRELIRVASLFKYFQEVDEINEMSTTEKLLGKVETTLDEWIK